MKRIIIFLTLYLSFTTICYSQEYVKGDIVGNLHEKLKIVYGDKAVVNLGTANGIIKGDILNITKYEDTLLSSPIGQCAVIKTYESKSICEIINMKQEIENMNVVYIKRIKYTDPVLFPHIFKLLVDIVEPYEPYKDLSIYVFNFVDEQKNITQFSELLKKEIKNVFSQKKRIKLVTDDVGSIFKAYNPNEVSEKNRVIEGYMKKDNIDVLISGVYEAQGDKLKMTLYKTDRNWGIGKQQGIYDAGRYREMLATVTVPYTPMKKEQNIICNFLFDPVRVMPKKIEKEIFIQRAATDDPFLQYSLNKVDFNIISPVEFKIQIGKDVIEFDKQTKAQLLLSTGKHELIASFKKGLFSNETLMFTLPDEYKKTVVLHIDKGDELNVDVKVNPLFVRDPINFNIYTTVIKSRPVLKPVIRTEKSEPVETYKD